MLTLDILVTFARELLSFINDVSRFFTEILSNIHHFLNKFLPDEVILMFGILIAAFLAIMLFRAVLNKR